MKSVSTSFAMMPFLLFGLGVCLWSAPACSAQLPERTMEAGIGLVGQVSADYRGSEHYRLRALPIPYFLYRGKIIKADRGGVRGDFLANDRFEFNLSLGAALNGDSDDNKLRQGMPELQSALEFGPSFNVNLTGATFNEGWALRLPVRAVFTVEPWDVDSIGFIINPRLTWRHPDVVYDWSMSFNLGLLYGNRRYHDYYYGVDPAYVTPARPAYSAEPGYSGSFARVALYRQRGDWRFGFALRYDNLAGATFTDSPLVETEQYVSFSFGITYRLWSNYQQ